MQQKHGQVFKKENNSIKHHLFLNQSNAFCVSPPTSSPPHPTGIVLCSGHNFTLAMS